MNAIQNIILVVIILGFAGIEYWTGQSKSINASKDDNKLELFMFISLVAITQPLIFFLTGKAGSLWFPEYKNVWANLPVWAMVGILLVGDDMLQYWWHRLSHSPFMWPLHRAHHSAHYMSMRMTYRNNFFYYLMMPGIWVSGVLIYMGFANVYLAYVIVKLTVIMGAHCAVPWDKPLYNIKALKPIMWVVERTISTPATHWAHHALTNQDGIGYYKGNFGNLLFFWDILFGSAYITQKFPAKVGLQDDLIFGKERWFTEMFYPIFKSKREYSALATHGKIYAEADTAMPTGAPTA